MLNVDNEWQSAKSLIVTPKRLQAFKIDMLFTFVWISLKSLFMEFFKFWEWAIRGKALTSPSASTIWKDGICFEFRYQQEVFLWHALGPKYLHSLKQYIQYKKELKEYATL